MEVTRAQHKVTEQAVLTGGGQQLSRHPSASETDGLLLTVELRALEAVLRSLM
jgi:hypothetical protein